MASKKSAKPAPRRLLGDRFGIATQIVPTHWGLRTGKETCINLTVSNEFSGAMDMDAPDLFPSGSMARAEIGADYFSPKVTYCFRGV